MDGLTSAPTKKPAPPAPAYLGKRVIYSQTADEADWNPAGAGSLAAIITAWNEQTSLADLTIFPAKGCVYIQAKRSVPEGTTTGTFQLIVE